MKLEIEAHATETVMESGRVVVEGVEGGYDVEVQDALHCDGDHPWSA